MARFSVGDRVQLVGDVARFYPSVIGVIIHDTTNPSSVLNQYRVRLADGTFGIFFDFQLHSPSGVRAQVVFDSSVSKRQSGTRGTTPGRHIQLASRDIELHLKIDASPKKSIVGQLTLSAAPLPLALVTLSAGNQAIETKTTDDSGIFEFGNVAAAAVTIEVFVPDRRVLASLSV